MALTSRDTAMAYVLLALTASAARAGSHSRAPTLAVDCVSQAAILIDCLDYIHQGSTKHWLAAASWIEGGCKLRTCWIEEGCTTPLPSMGRRA
jgi:hypothetical protein